MTRRQLADRDYPVYFTTGAFAIGRDFTTLVHIRGRMLVRTSADLGGVTIYGVNPGLAAATGPNMAKTFKRFRKEVQDSLLAVAATVDSYEEFKQNAQAMLNVEAPAFSQRWSDADEAMRCGELENELGIPEVEVEEPVRASMEFVRLRPWRPRWLSWFIPVQDEQVLNAVATT